jgi:hypothetical protein
MHLSANLFDRLMEEMESGRSALWPLLVRHVRLAVRTDDHLEAAEELAERFRSDSSDRQTYSELAEQLRQARLNSAFLLSRRHDGMKAAEHINRAESILVGLASALLIEAAPRTDANGVSTSLR